jgi:ribose transport system permease protein
MPVQQPITETAVSPVQSAPSRVAQSVFTSTTLYVAVAVVILAAIFALMTGGNFLSITNMQSIGRNSAGLILLAIGLTFVLGAGHIDLSVGATLVLSSVVAAKTTAVLSVSGDVGAATALGACAALATGIVMGLINGLLVTKLKINSFVVTLGTMGIGIGAAQVITNGSNVTGLPSELQGQFGLGTWLGVPLPLLLAIVVGAAAALVLWQTVFGRHTLAVGSAENGARRAGVRVQTTTVGVFLLAGTLAGLAGFLDISRFGTTAISGHETTMLQALSAVIIGGTSLYGGRASVLGAVIATFITTVLTAGFVMIGVSSFYQRIAIGVVLIFAVWVDRVRRPASDRQ